MPETSSPICKDGRYQLSTTDTGVFLSVWSPDNLGSPVKKSAIIQELTKQNLLNFESDFISLVIKEALGEPIQIITALLSQDGRYQITTTDDGVHLSVWSSTGTGLPVRKSAIIQELHKQNLIDFESDFISLVIKEALGKPIQIINSQLSQNGYYEITTTDAGVHLSVWPPVKGGLPVKKSDLIEELNAQNFTQFDNNFLSQVIKEALGFPILIVNSVLTAPEPMAQIRIKIRRDRLEASIDVTIPQGAPEISMSQVLEKLQSAGVIHGIDEQALESLLESGPEASVICASGTPPCDGEKAFLKYHVDIDSQGCPEDIEYGRVDFKETNIFFCVEEGQLLVEKIPATPGTPGIDVFGLPIPARPGKDIPLPIGKNLILVDDWRLYAAINGHLHIVPHKRVNVIPVIEINGDVDYGTGNIDFKGSVIVRGSVQPGFSVKAGGNIEIFGTICGGTVEGDNIMVHTGVQGMNRSVVKARERLITKFIENAIVYADQEVIVSDVVLNSTVFAGIRVIIEGQRGLVRGGHISAGEEISAMTIGNRAHVATDIEVAVNPFLKNELLELHIDIKKSKILCAEMNRSLDYLRKQDNQTFSLAKQDSYKKKEIECQALTDHINESEERIINIEALLATLKPGRIRVHGTIYPGIKLTIGSSTRTLKETLQYSSVYVHGGEIRIAPLR